MDDSKHTQPDGASSEVRTPPSDIPDHELVRRIGEGSYGEVWLARSVVGSYHAIKVVYRRRFEDDTPYEREFRGIKRFEPVSRSHDGLINVLHVGRNDQAGYFYYVMELADHAGDVPGPAQREAQRLAPSVDAHEDLDPQTYDPKTLGKILTKQGHLALNECVDLGMALASALKHLHDQGLIHRDIKPSNIIFVHGKPKIADIGLVTELGSSKSFVGTEGFIPPEGPGSAQADVYSLGKVLYEASTGMDRRNFPVLPEAWADLPSENRWLELNEVVLKACEEVRAKRYQSADEIYSDLEFLQAGRSVKRLRALERRLTLMTRALAAGVLLVVIGLFAYSLVLRAQRLTKQRLAESYAAFATRSVNENDLLGALPWYAEALKLEQGNPARESRYRIYLAQVVRQCPVLTRMWFHFEEAESAQFSPDGGQILAAGSDNTMLVWDIVSNQRVLQLKGHTNGLSSAVYSHDGRLIATAGNDYTARIWKADDGTLLQKLTHPASVTQVEFHPVNSAILLTASTNKQAQLWDWKTQRMVLELTNRHAGPVRAASFSRDGRFIATGSTDGNVQLWNATTGQPLGNPLPHGTNNWIYDIEFSPDGKWIATATWKNQAFLWEIESGRHLWTWQHEAAVGSLSFSPDGRYLATGCWDLATRVWDVHQRTHLPIAPPIKHSSPVHRVAFDRTGRRLVTANAQGVVALWDLSPIHWRPRRTSNKYAPDGNTFLAVNNGSIQLHRAQNHALLSTHPIPAPAGSPVLHLTSDGARFLMAITTNGLAGETNVLLRLWDAHTGQPLGPDFLSVPYKEFCLSSSGKYFAACYETNGMVWSTATGQPVRTILTAQPILSPMFDPQERYLGLASGPTVAIYEVSSTREPLILQHNHRVQSVEFHPFAPKVLTACRDTTLLPRAAQIWDLDTGQPSGPPMLHDDGVRLALFSPDGTRVATASEDNTAQVWDAKTGRRLGPPLQHRFQVYTVRFSPDGTRVVTASKDRSIRVWNAWTGESITPPLKHDLEVWDAQFIEDGTAILSLDQDYRQWLWDLQGTTKSVRDLEELAQLLSRRSIDPIGGAFRLDKQRLEAHWLRLGRLYPKDFTVDLEEQYQWHALEAEQCEARQLWQALRFHLDRLLELRPNDQALIERRNRIPGTSAPGSL